MVVKLQLIRLEQAILSLSSAQTPISISDSLYRASAATTHHQHHSPSSHQLPKKQVFPVFHIRPRWMPKSTIKYTNFRTYETKQPVQTINTRCKQKRLNKLDHSKSRHSHRKTVASALDPHQTCKHKMASHPTRLLTRAFSQLTSAPNIPTIKCVERSKVAYYVKVPQKQWTCAVLHV